MKSFGRGPLQAIVYGGLTAGTLDIGAASLIYRLNPVVVLHSVASGILGQASFSDGTPSALLGLGLQWGMSLVIAAVYAVAAGRAPALARSWIRGGVIYGVVIFVVMNYVVVPLSAAWPKQSLNFHSVLNRFTPDKFFGNLAAMLVFGLIVAFFTHRSARRSSSNAGFEGADR